MVRRVGNRLEWNPDIIGKNGKLAQDLAIGKAVAGTAMFWAFWQMSADGWFNQGPADNYNEAMVRKMRDGIPYGFRVGDMSYDAEKLGPIGFYMSIVNDLYHMKDHAAKGEYIAAVEEAMMQMGHHLTQTGPISGIADLFSAMKDPGRFGQGYINPLLTALATPASVGMSQIAHQIDPYEREISTGGENVRPGMTNNQIAQVALNNELNRLKKQWMRGVPFASTYLEPQIDLFGQPVPTRDFYGVYALKAQQDPVFQVLDKLKYFPAPIPKRIGAYNLPETTHTELAVKSGVLMHQAMLRTISKPNFNNFNPLLQHKLLQINVQSARQQARMIIQAKYPEIAKANADWKIALAQPLPGEEPATTP